MNNLYFPAHFCCALLLFVFTENIFPQTAQIEGLRQNTPRVHILTNARIVIAPGEILSNGKVLLRNGIIENVGADIDTPADARVWNMQGKTLYAGFIESYSDYGMMQSEQRNERVSDGPLRRQQNIPEVSSGSPYWNAKIQAQKNARENFSPDAKTAERLRRSGFTSALCVPQKGNIKGTSALVNLSDKKGNESILKNTVAMHANLDVDQSADGYPNSLMGCIALLRQTLYDADWYKKANDAYAKNPSLPRPETNVALASLQNVLSAQQPFIIEASSDMNALRAKKIADEFKLKLIVRGSGMEYRRITAIKNLNTQIILPVNFPKAPSVATPEEAADVEWSELMHWDIAPENPKRLYDAGISFALTSATMKDQDKFLENVRAAVERGFPADAALAALTTIPAKMFGVENSLGTIEKGKIANIIIADGDIFGEKTKILESWIDGERYEIIAQPTVDVRGKWETSLQEKFILHFKGEMNDISGTITRATSVNDTVKHTEEKMQKISFTQQLISFLFNGDSIGLSGIVRMSGTISGNEIVGNGERGDGTLFQWIAQRTAPFTAAADTAKKKRETISASFAVPAPPMPFGREKLPEQPEYIFINDATLWVTDSTGKKAENADMLIHKGTIEKIGTNLSAPSSAVIIEAKGKHITPGIIDCHSHSGASGSVNEGGQAITAEVRIGDVVDADDISLYRELAGGVTAINILHGSANAIGGQNQVIKLRWGMLPEEMKFENAMQGIKFALGENPKQSNWGDQFTTRYPQTRMGVQQIIRDEFSAARDYEKMWRDYREGKSLPPRRDLELDAITEILNKKRLVHCHSYRQDEILAMMRTAEEFGFQIGTFQHILEGYKVADGMAKHGVGGSSFSDWWAYKFEVYDAIPYNGALMHNEGVTVSFNSDSDEMARRLNDEAAKAVKYGRLTEEEAIKFVTLNPAKQLRINNRVGSLEVGKDADFVVWNGNPLSSLSKCEQTWIDGKKFFDAQEDSTMQKQIQHQRAVLIQKILQNKQGSEGSGESPWKRRGKENKSCHEGI
jgi:imidazolonepropionase-like amidohydrolase